METGEPTFFHSYSVDLNDENSIRSLIVDMIGSDKRVLVVGIGLKGLTNILTEHNNTVQEIEIHSESCLIKEESCEYFVSIDGKQVNVNEFLEKSSFDIILLKDILGHLKNPSDLLKKWLC
jgi:2-polyprenyl-3-methyl-5-hydroxy-6-metoxy-1,4-benzoquinol methylase